MMSKSARAWRTYRDVTKPGTPGLMARVRAIPRMIGASARGEFGARKNLALMALGVLYIVSPIDVIPDFLVGIGVVDDFGVFLWLISAMLGESGRYVEWERKQIRSVPS
ncbi:YkvA family protein [Nonomuraea sp. NPDC050536]|uniref:YkvA family protein n=1 Tax=Nonomuraea sp. NPDC050536 TaxID=3364366 RepID=UPI0037CC6DCA